MDNQPITERVQRTERTFTAIDGTFASLAARASDGVRIWLDNGIQKQVARNIVIGENADKERVVHFMIRGPEDKQQQFETDADEPIQWYEEVHP